ncbi:hypothetical protein EJ997_06875 [Flaviflexus ciconiae]|uniref:Putative endonuclease Z1 domain-containing protein n=1 Tax=Flaviflexus ciconiae TaxID=2496867 RepID=A0A3Q9G6Z2_9ACTO|nr:Z1 domain-containing protein [Flaviflexus ciconiae]AZQ77092.1 hypothetical protein EJ997_06875 [Flaviflexus ciconiae]
MNEHRELLIAQIEEVRNDKSKTFLDACDIVQNRMALFFPEAKTIIESIREEYLAKAGKARTVYEHTTATSGANRVYWYMPPARLSGVWEQLKARMSDSGLAEAVDSIDESSDQVMVELAEPFLLGDKRRGLAVGNVQSGKTANYAAVISKAVDEGYKFIIVLSGLYKNLRRQTQGRLERDLGITQTSHDWHRLTALDGDIGTADLKNVGSAFNNKRVIAVVKKNSKRLEYLTKFLKAAGPKILEKTPILIIDDESDQATPDSSNEKSDSPTPINQHMRNIWDLVENGTYVGYTATPFANVFMDPEEEDGLYPADFMIPLPTSESYFGAEELFGLKNADTNAPDVIREIPKGELEFLMPRNNRENQTFAPQVTESLEKAIRWFIVGVAIRRLRGQMNQHSTMLLHTTHRTEAHFRLRDAVKLFLAKLEKEALDGDVSSFYDTFVSEVNKAAELYTGDDLAPTWPKVQEQIGAVLRTLTVAVDNGYADEFERLSYTGDRAKTLIVIGGSTLSRGLTLEGLFVSFFTRTSNTYDTLLQMGRWFGYRSEYEDLQRIWVSDGLDSDYRFLAQVEADLRIEISRLTASGQTPRQIGVRIKQHPGRLQITAKNKQKHAKKVAVDFEGFRLQTTALDVSSLEKLDRNQSAAEELLAGILAYKNASDAVSRHQPILFEGVPFAYIDKFLAEFKVHDKHNKLVLEAMEWTKEKLPETPWNVVIASGNGSDTFEFEGFEVRKPIRSVQKIKNEDEGLSLEVGAMMSGGDLILDLEILGRAGPKRESPLSNAQQFDLRATTAGGDGYGLLVLYPLSGNSLLPDREISLNKKILEEHSVSDGRQIPQVFGLGLVAPFDVDNVVKNKGVYFAVKPAYVDEVDEEYEVDIPNDDERDYEGDTV